DPEVEELHGLVRLPGCDDEDVLRLHVQVDDRETLACLRIDVPMRVIERAEDLAREAHNALHAEICAAEVFRLALARVARAPSRVEELLVGLAVQELHDVVRTA